MLQITKLTVTQQAQSLMLLEMFATRGVTHTDEMIAHRDAIMRAMHEAGCHTMGQIMIALVETLRVTIKESPDAGVSPKVVAHAMTNMIQALAEVM